MLVFITRRFGVLHTKPILKDKLVVGLYIESPTECAARELREETGIQLEPFRLDNAPYVDIQQTENFNPHKGK